MPDGPIRVHTSIYRTDRSLCLCRDATPLYIAPQDTELEKLQAHVKQLESLISAFPSTSASSQPSTAVPRAARPSNSAPHGSRPASTLVREATVAAEVERFDLVAQDLLGALISLVVSGGVTPPRAGRDSFLPNGQSGSAVIDEAKRLQDSHARENLELPVISALAVEDFTLPTIMPLIPPESKLRAAYDFYHEYYAWICPSVNVREIDKRWPAMKAALDARDPTPFTAPAEAQFLALVLSVCTMGISRMPEALARELGLDEEKATNGASWARVASLVLHAGEVSLARLLANT